MIYDITRELFGAEVYPGDPVPSGREVMSLKKQEPDVCQLTELTLGSHSGTHVDAPAHFYREGKSVSEMDLEKCMGPCLVVSAEGEITREQAKDWIRRGIPRLLIKGEAVLGPETARFLAGEGLCCIGIEGLSVGPLSCPVEVHRILLAEEIVILEGLCLDGIRDGSYELIALPLKMAGVDGSPVRAVLRDTL